MPNKIATFLQAVWYLVFPPFRRKINAEWGFWTLTHACGHLLLSEGCDRNDLDAARILNNKAKEINASR